MAQVNSDAVDTADVMDEQFAALQQEIPEMESIEQLPAGVREIADGEGVTLLDAYLRYQLREQRAIAAERARQQEAADQSAGSMYTGASCVHPAADAFAHAFEQALQ